MKCLSASSVILVFAMGGFLHLARSSSFHHKRSSCCFVDLFCFQACFYKRNMGHYLNHSKRTEDKVWMDKVFTTVIHLFKSPPPAQKYHIPLFKFIHKQAKVTREGLRLATDEKILLSRRPFRLADRSWLDHAADLGDKT